MSIQINDARLFKIARLQGANEVGRAIYMNLSSNIPTYLPALNGLTVTKKS